jgi:hypothetical protein
LAGCSSADAGRDDSDFASREATLLDFEFDGQLLTDQGFDPTSQIEAQLLFTVGHLNHDRSVARLDKHTITNVQTSDEPSGLTRIKYHVKIPVAWGSKTRLPTSYELRLPLDVSFDAQQRLFDRVKETCIEFGAHDPDVGSFFYYYRPKQTGCDLRPEEISVSVATARKSPENTRNKFPEYDKIWEDQALKVVAIFGKFEDGKTSGDAGIDAYNEFVRAVRSELGSNVRTKPENVPANPGVEMPDVQLDVTLPGGRSIQVVALLVDNVRQGGPAFNARYNELSTDADLIAYNGHAGLGQNVRALAQMGKFKAKKYQIFFMNGCDTFAYVDGALAQTRARLNPDDPTGTKYMEFITNAMPSFFHSMPSASMALVRGLKAFEAPKTYEQIFANIDRAEVVLVTGEEDNTFRP